MIVKKINESEDDDVDVINISDSSDDDENESEDEKETDIRDLQERLYWEKVEKELFKEQLQIREASKGKEYSNGNKKRTQEQRKEAKEMEELIEKNIFDSIPNEMKQFEEEELKKKETTIKKEKEFIKIKIRRKRFRNSIHQRNTCSFAWI